MPPATSTLPARPPHLYLGPAGNSQSSSALILLLCVCRCHLPNGWLLRGATPYVRGRRTCRSRIVGHARKGWRIPETATSCNLPYDLPSDTSISHSYPQLS